MGAFYTTQSKDRTHYNSTHDNANATPAGATGGQELLDQVRHAIRLRHYSRRTEQAYINWIKRFIIFHGKKHPKQMGAKEVQEFLSHLAVRENVAASTQNQALCAIIFLYKQVLIIELPVFEEIEWAKKPKKLPMVFSKAEVNLY